MIIGGGPGGNTAATVAASLGAEVTLIERDVDRRRRAPLRLHPEQGDGRDRQRARRARRARTRWASTPSGRLDVPALRTRIARHGGDAARRRHEPARVAGRAARCAGTGRLVERVHGRGDHRRRRRGDRGRRDPARDRLAAARARVDDDRRRAHPHDPPGLPAARDPRAPRGDRLGRHRRRVHAHVQRARLAGVADRVAPAGAAHEGPRSRGGARERVHPAGREAAEGRPRGVGRARRRQGVHRVRRRPRRRRLARGVRDRLAAEHRGAQLRGRGRRRRRRTATSPATATARRTSRTSTPRATSRAGCRSRRSPRCRAARSPST